MDEGKDSGSTAEGLLARYTGGPRLARFQSAQSPIEHDLKIVLNSTIPRFSTIFEQNNRGFLEKKC